jgi:ubiquinone/menaquinone biosynthesis C-methylase UbiE
VRREQRRPDPVVLEHRRRLLAGLTGDVVEVGCGDGRNFRHYPPGVEWVLAIEPDPIAREEAERRATEVSTPIEVVAGEGEALPAADDVFDAGVCSWVLCTVGDPAAALAELRRVLKPAGELRFYEHVRSRNRAFELLQRAVDATFWPPMLGCLTARNTEAAIRAAGFEISSLERPFHASSLVTLPSAPHILGVARAQPL